MGNALQASAIAVLWIGAVRHVDLVAAAEPCRVRIVDQQNGWPVPLVELRTTHDVRFVSDNAGVIALDLPEFMGRETWFDVRGHGYEVPVDGFGSRGVRMKPEPGRTIDVRVQRKIIAKRLGRLTGAGLFAESQKLGAETEWRESGITGCDSVLTTAYRGKLFWLWGDTNVPHYPLGIYSSSSAATTLQPLKSFEPLLRMNFEYFRDEHGRPRGVAPMPGPGPTWITGYVSLRDQAGTEKLVGTYMKITPPLTVYEWGLCVWNDEQAKFEPHRKLWTKTNDGPAAPPVPDGHAARWRDEAGREWLLFGNPLPRLRVPATFEAWQNPEQWEVLKPQENLPAVGHGKPVRPHSGSIAWSGFRKRWVTVFMEHFGKPSAFGELWYAEASTPTGPWGAAIKILSHDNYTFYNPRCQPELTPDGSPVLLFEGTYTKQFANHPDPTPRYDYNQILYRLDLDDPALAPAQQ